MSSELPPDSPPPSEEPPTATSTVLAPPVSRRAADRPAPPRDPSKAPVAVPVMGAAAIVVAMLTLCAGGLRLVNPEGAIGAALGPIFEVSVAKNAILVAMVTWILMSILLAVAGAGLLLTRPWGRTLGLVYAWASVLAMAVMIAGNAIFLAPSLDNSDVAGSDVFWAVIAGPSVGCCPLAFALVMLVALHHEAVGAWARHQK